MNKFFLKNKLTFIVGGAGTIGKEIVKLFASAESKIIILDSNKQTSKDLISKLSKDNVIFEYFDCSSKNIEKNFIKMLNKYNCPDIFINCSYPLTKNFNKTSFAKISKKILDENIILHLNSYAWLAKLVAEKMKQKKISGSIIQFGSIYGVLGQDLTIYKNTKMTENMPYSIIKGGIINLTRQMASFYGKNNIRINTICPGGIKEAVQGVSKTQEKSFIKNYSNKVPLGRLADSQEISYSALFLASDASSYITGLTLMVDGGWSAI